MWTFGFILTFLVSLRSIGGQYSLGCPQGWELNVGKCYKFESNNKLIFEEADAACWVSGATLLIVNNYQEHIYISNWLLKHAVPAELPWFTNGAYYRPGVIWDVDGSLDQSTPQYWVDDSSPALQEKFIRIAYVRGGNTYNGFGWKVVSQSIPSNYICEISQNEVVFETQIAERNFSYGLGDINIQNIPKAPHMTLEPGAVMVLDIVSSLFLECLADGIPHPSYKWYKNGEEITSNTDSRYTLSTGRFSIQNPSAAHDEDKYHCEATNELGVTLSNPVMIAFGYLQSFSPVKPQDVSANKFEGTRINCNAPPSFPSVTYTWFMYNTDQPIFENHMNMFMSSTGYLYFSEVQPTDQRQYFCVVTLTSASQYHQHIGLPVSRTGLKFWLIVTGTEHGYFKPFIYTHTSPSPAIRGARIRIECIAYGSLPLKYTWQREGGLPFEKETTLSDLNRVLTINNAKISAEGNYICTVAGLSGVSSTTVTVSIEAKPYFPFGISDRFVDPGQTLKWRCKAVAKPEPQYAWFKNGKQIVPIDGEIQIFKNYLWIKKVQAERDEGMYQCAVSNIHGTTFSSGQLKVLSFKPTFVRHPLPAVTYIPQGGDYTIPCRVEAAPTAEVVWLKNGSPLSLVRGEITGKLGMTVFNDLVFRVIDYSDQGLYTCKATNINGEATNSTQVNIVRSIDIPIDQGPRDGTVPVNGTAFFYCQASWDSLNFELTYVWRHNGYIIDFDRDIHFVKSKKENLDGLWIQSAQFEHSGRYTCEARTTFHSASRSADLLVTGPPGAPAGVHVRTPITNRFASVIWTVTVGMNHGSPINRYDIEAELSLKPGKWSVIASNIPEEVAMTAAHNLGLRSDQRMAIVTELLPNMFYNFRVRAINHFGKGQEAGWTKEQVKTDSSAPVTVPRNISGKEDGKVGTLHVQWEPLDPTEYASDGVGYYVYFKKEGDPKEFFKGIVNGALNSSYSHLVGEENYYLPYSVMVAAFNKLGHGPNSTLKTVMSADGMPIATVVMGDCNNYNGTAFSMTWTPIPENREAIRGRLRGYRVRYYEKDQDEYVTWRDLYGQQDRAIIIGLKSNTNYWASVQVMNFAGVGPIGEVRLAETFHKPPIDFPRHVAVFPSTTSSVRVTWQGVTIKSFEEETLLGYKIRLWKIQEDIRTAVDMVVDKVDEAIIENLQTKTVYVLRVLAYSIGGDGALSSHVYFNVEGGNIPFDPTTTQICYSQQECNAATCLNISIVTVLFVNIIHILF